MEEKKGFFKRLVEGLTKTRDNVVSKIDEIFSGFSSIDDDFYDEIEEIETLIEEVETRLYNIRQEKISGDNVYQFLLFFDKLYDRFTDIEKKTFMKSFLADVNIYEEEQADGRILRSLKFRFPVFFNGKEIYELDWDNESTVETVVGLQRKDT